MKHEAPKGGRSRSMEILFFERNWPRPKLFFRPGTLENRTLKNVASKNNYPDKGDDTTTEVTHTGQVK